MAPRIDFQTEPARYRHWRLAFDGELATLSMDVDENGGLFAGYQLKLNSYDLGVDIELADAVQRLRFEHPEVKVVVLRSGKERVFCAGANIRMLAGATHAHKVNFCKFTNETRNAMEDASGGSSQKYICAVRGTAAGGGYELALATDQILLADDGSSTVALPELPLLAVLPGTGGLTRITDKRKVRRDLADAFCTVEEGVKGERAVAWRLVDQAVPTTRFERAVKETASALAAQSDRPGGAARGIRLTEVDRTFSADGVTYSSLKVAIDRASRRATLTVSGPRQPPPASVAAMQLEGAAFWPLRLARELDDAILHLRLNEPQIGVLIFGSEGEGAGVLAHDAFLAANGNHWLAREILLYWKRVLKRVDVTSRSLVALIEPDGCFAGTLAELVFACDRSFMLIGGQGGNRPCSTVALSALNFGAYPMGNGLSRLATRFLGEPARLDALKGEISKPLAADACEELGLVTSTLDDIDWHDEVRIFLEERASFSADGLTGMEANLRFAGPETMETKIFGRLSAWQNWIFQRPNAVGAQGALKLYGSGVQATFDKARV